MRSRLRVRNDEWTLTSRTYWLLRTWSPLANLVGMAAGGVLLVRLILVFGVANGEYVFGLDIPIAALVLVVWAVLMIALLRTPSSVLAGGSATDGPRVLVGPLQSRSSISIFIAVPLVGLIGAMTPFPLPIAVIADDGPEKFVGLSMSTGMTLVSVMFVWVTARSARRGVELTRTTLLAFGYLRSQRVPRAAVARIDVVESIWLVRFGYFMLRIDGMDHCLRITYADGASQRLVASNAPRSNAERGARLVREWAGLEA